MGYPVQNEKTTVLQGNDIMKVAGKVLLENIEIPERGQIGVQTTEKTGTKRYLNKVKINIKSFMFPVYSKKKRLLIDFWYAYINDIQSPLSV